MDDAKKSIVGDVAGISAPLTKLIESVSKGIGVLYEPVRVRRLANAESDARLMLAKADAKVTGIAKRALDRMSHNEIRRQHNIDRVVTIAQEELPPSVNDQPVDDDWLAAFFNIAQDISNEDMQRLWARLLAGEVAAPGSFSQRTLAFVKTMSKYEADCFTQYCSYLWEDSSTLLMRVCFDSLEKYIESKGLGSGIVSHLHAIGLIHQNEYTLAHNDGHFDVKGRYGEMAFHMVKSKTNRLPPLHLIESLTVLGAELYSISGFSQDTEYSKQIISAFTINGFTEVK